MFSRYNVAPPSWRYTILILTMIGALVLWAILQGNATGYILAVVLLVFVSPMVVVVFVNRAALHRMETVPMDQSERDALISQYKSGYDEVRAALQQLSEADLDRRPASGGWTPREIVHHLADSETIGMIRFRRLLAEERPLIQSYDEEQFARKLHYDRPITASLEVLQAVRSSNSELLEWMSDEEWGREGTHSESGNYTVEDWLRIYAAHAHDHATQMLQVKEA